MSMILIVFSVSLQPTAGAPFEDTTAKSLTQRAVWVNENDNYYHPI